MPIGRSGAAAVAYPGQTVQDHDFATCTGQDEASSTQAYPSLPLLLFLATIKH